MQTKELQLKKALRTVLFILMLNVAGMLKGYAVTIGDLNYDLDNGTLTATITSHKDGTDAIGNLTIPSTVTYTTLEYIGDEYVYVTRTYTVTEISGYYVYNNWYGAFQGCSGLTGSLTIPSSVTSIGRNAFSGCSGFTGILTIPDSVTSIGRNAFFNCSGFSEVHYNAFGCSALSYIDYINNSVVYVPPFQGCGGSLIIGNNIETIPVHLFRGGAFSGSLIIPNSVTSIGREAFRDCSGFNGSLIIGNSVTTIGELAFYGCNGLTGDLNIPNSVTTIGSNAFYDCSGFTGNLTISNSVTTINYDTFYGCSGFMGNLIIPNAVTSIGRDAFRDCSGFTEVHFNATNCADVDASVRPFTGVGGSLIIGDNVERIPNYMFKNAAFTGNLTIPNSVTYIGTEAFGDCTGFTGNLTIGNSVTTIGNSAFSNCTGFTGSLIFGNSVITIYSKAFKNCSGFTGNLTIPNSVTSIYSEAFRGCSGFTGSLIIGNSVTSIGDYAFSGCNGFTGNLTIGNSVTIIGSSAFRSCRHLTSMTVLADNPPVLGDYAFYDCPKSTPVYVPCGSAEAFLSAAGWNEFTNIQDICTQSQTIELSQGTNWFSTYLDITLEDLQTALAAATPNDAITIKSSSGNSVYTKRTHSWNTPASFVWDVAMKYDIVMAADCEITLEGMPINPAEHPITILGHGSTTWIGFPFAESMTLAEAFAQIVLNGDKVKSSNGNATYTRGNWNGNFSTLEPGKGYLYVSPANAEDRTFTFPTGAK